MSKSTQIPSGDEVRAALAPYSVAGVSALSLQSGVPAPTIAKIKWGETRDPRVSTVRLLWPLIAPRSSGGRGRE